MYTFILSHSIGPATAVLVGNLKCAWGTNEAR